MFNNDVAKMIERELNGLKQQLLAYPNEADMWTLPQGINNSTGTLALHLCGNLRHYIGANLGNSGYQRNRVAEFAERNVPRTEILTRIDQAIADVKLGLGKVSEEMLDAPYPEIYNGRTFRNREWILHLVSHLSYHLGQIDYHRRTVTGSSESAGTLSLNAL